jgi:chromosome partition protein MukF
MEQDSSKGPPSIASVIAEVWHSGFSLQLGREETAFIAGIHARLRGMPIIGIDEDELRRVYNPVYELAQAGSDSEAQRATHIIGRLKEQGILFRTDSGGLSYEGEYALSPLGLALCEGMESDRSLTRRSLEFMLVRMRTELAQVLAAAHAGGSAEHWESKVIFPMRYVMLELIGAVDKRQRGLDSAHKLLRERITALFDSEWLAAVDTCIDIVRGVDDTLRELNTVLSEHVESIERQLLDLSGCAGAHPDLAIFVERAHNQLLRLEAWGSRRYEDWTRYYRNVQEYIRDFVQTDPDNRLRGRLAELMRHFQTRPYSALLVGPEPFRHVREVLRPVPVTSLAVSDEVLSAQGVDEEADAVPDRVELAVIEMVQRLCTDGEIDIVAAVREIGGDFTEEECFTLLSHATPELLKHGMTPEWILRQQWIVLSAHLEAQTLKLQVSVHAEIGRTSQEPDRAQPTLAKESP